MKNSLTIIIGIIIIVAVAWFAMSSSNDVAITPSPTPSTQSVQLAPSPSPVISPSVSPMPSGSASASVTVSIDDEGFVPATVTVKAGTKVTFINNGQGLHWPASDPHPTHIGLPGLDPLKGLSTGETFSFMFTKIGTFGIHDHLSPRTKGTIVVQ